MAQENIGSYLTDLKKAIQNIKKQSNHKVTIGIFEYI